MTVDKLTEARDAALVEFKATGPAHLNCCQSVLRCSLSVMDGDPDLVLLGRYFGAGIARMGQVCGTLSGAALSLGLRDYLIPGHDADASGCTVERMQELVRAFKAEFGGLTCLELTGFDVSTPEGHAAAKAADATKNCHLFVSWVCDHVAPLLAE